MILRRLAAAIAEQNWFTVILEVAIVVVGIYLVAKHNAATFVQASLQELLSAGRLTIIENSSLRQMLVEMLQAY